MGCLLKRHPVIHIKKKVVFDVDKKPLKVKSSLIIIILSIAVLILGIVLLINDSKSYHNEKCREFAKENLTFSKGQIVFLGDSITDLCELDNYYEDLELKLYNRGISGDTTIDLKNRLDVSAFEIEPSIIVLMIGTNDINWGRSINAIMETYEEIVSEIYNRLPNVKLYVMSVIPQNKDLESYTPFNIDTHLPRIIELNQEITKLSTKYDFTYIDLYPSLLDSDGYLDKKYSDDGLHLNHNGFIVWSNILKPHLNTHD